MTVADCTDSPRPCCLFRCEFNLLVDSLPTGSIQLNLGREDVEYVSQEVYDRHGNRRNRTRTSKVHPNIPAIRAKDSALDADKKADAFVEALAEYDGPSCLLDLVGNNPGGMTLEEIGRAMNFTRERARQVVDAALAKLGLRITPDGEIK